MSSDSSVFSLRKPFKRNNLFNVLRVVIVAMILCTIAFPAFARADSKTIVVNLWIGNSVMSVNGLRQPIDSQGTKPVILESRTLVPIRAIIEAFGGEVGWDGTTRKVTITFSNNTLELWIGQSIASLNDYTVPIDSTNSKVVPMIISGRTMVPLRFVAESFGIDVQYDDKTKMITLTYVAETTPIVQLPVAPMLASPTNNSTLNNSNITFTWTAVSGVDYYKLQIIKDGLTLNSFESITTNSYTLTGTTLADGTYSWQVAAHNSAGWSSWSAPSVFVISTIQLPQAPTLTSPASNSTFTDSNITFTWTAVSGVDYYKLQITKDNIAVNTADNISSNTYTLTGYNLDDGTYSWQVAAYNSAGWSPWSTSFVFTINKQLSVTDIAKFVDRVVYIEVTGYKDGKPSAASGSGFIISGDGTIVTNYHVIDGATSGTVTLNDGMKYDIVSVLGYAKPKEITDKDLAIIKINASNLPVCTLGDSGKVQVGESVVAIGSPLGLPNVVSNGIVSKVWGEGIIQITAPISPGNSGGPLFNMYGEVIGVNTFKIVSGENLNFALPINWLKTIDTSLNMTLEQVYQKEYGSLVVLPGALSLIAPANESVLTTTTPTLTWTQVSNVDYYGVAVMEGSVKDTDKIIWAAFPTTTSITIPSGKLQTGKIYTWVVVAHNSYGYGNDSYAWHFSIAAPQLTAPVLLSPDDKKSVIPKLVNYTLSFSWSPVAGASSYLLWIGIGTSGAESTNVYKKTTTGTSLSIPTSTLLSGEIYTWAVGAINGEGKIVGSEDRHFSIVEENAISLITPYNGERASIVFLSWTSYIGADEYFVLVVDEYDNVVYTNITTITMDVVPSDKLIWGSKYHWMVAAVKGNYSIACSSSGVFYYGY